MKIRYKAGPCSKRCCPEGDTHLQVVELRGGARFVRGGDAVEVSDELGKKLIADHPGMFVGPSTPTAKKPAEVKK